MIWWDFYVIPQMTMRLRRFIFFYFLFIYGWPSKVKVLSRPSLHSYKVCTYLHKCNKNTGKNLPFFFLELVLLKSQSITVKDQDPTLCMVFTQEFDLCLHKFNIFSLKIQRWNNFNLQVENPCVIALVFEIWDCVKGLFTN